MHSHTLGDVRGLRLDWLLVASQESPHLYLLSMPRSLWSPLSLSEVPSLGNKAYSHLAIANVNLQNLC
jgi:hypothetical protein